MPGTIRERANLRFDAHSEPGEGPVPRRHHLPHIKGIQGGCTAGGPDVKCSFFVNPKVPSPQMVDSLSPYVNLNLLSNEGA